MKRIAVLGVTAAIVVLGCTAAPGDDDDSQGSGTGGVPPAASGGSTAVAGKGGSGGTPAMTGNTGGTTGSGGMTGSGGATVGSGGATAGSGGMTGGTGGMSMDDGGIPPGDNFMPSCIKAGKELVLIGDSYINYIQNLEPRLREHAIMEGALMQGDRYDDHAQAGWQLHQDFGEVIPDQWYGGTVSTGVGAKAGMPKFVVMDGGGNDVIIGMSRCENDDAAVMIEKDEACQKVVKDGMDAAISMIEDMKKSGVQQVLYFYYPNTPIGGHRILDYAFNILKDRLAALNDDTFHAYLHDNRPVFADHPDDWYADGIHPTGPAADAMAAAIWARMKTECMAQTTASGGECCTP